MEAGTAQVLSAVAAGLSAVAAVFSAATAYKNLALTHAIQADAKADERLVVGALSHPDLREPSHANAVVQIPLFNKSKRKAFISEVTAYDQANRPLVITWAESISDLGEPQHPAKLVGVIDSATIYARFK